jgi:hypothetical protein
MTIHSGDLYIAEKLDGLIGENELSRTDQFAPSAGNSDEYEFVSQLPLQSETNIRRDRGIAFGESTGETEMYMGQESPPGVDAFNFGVCGSLECSSLQKLLTGLGAPSPFKTLNDITVDHSAAPGDWASGDVFAAEEGVDPGEAPAVDIFEPMAGGDEKYIGQVTGPSVSEPFKEIELKGIAVSGLNGDLVVGAALQGANAAVFVFRPEEEGSKTKKGKYTLVQKLVPPNGVLKELTAVAVDDSTTEEPYRGEIYVSTKTNVYEFGPEGSFRGDITGVPREGVPTGGQGEEVRFNKDTARPVSLAVDPTSHRVFVGLFGSQVGPKGENLAVVDVFGPDVVVPDVETKAPFNLELETNGSGAHSWGVLATGTVNPDNAGEASCSFVWGTSKQALNRVASCGEAGETIPNGNTPKLVDASLSGLAPDTTYYYRLQARNAQGTNLGEESQDYQFTTPGAGLESESASAVTSSSARLEATIAPHDAPLYAASEVKRRRDFQEPTNGPTTYYFEYSKESTEDCTQSSCTSVPLAPASIGTGVASVEVEQDLNKLASNATYHYRVVALSEALPKEVPGVIPTAEPGVQIAFYGPDHTFTTQGAGKPSALPDGRVWELVSPVDKHGARIEQNAQAALGGGEFTFLTGSPSTSSPGGYDGNGNQVLSSRVKPGLWSSADISLSHDSPIGVLAGVPSAYRFFSEGLSLAVAESLGPFSVPEGWHENKAHEWERIVESSPVPTERTPYIRRDSTCASQWSTCYEPVLYPGDTEGGAPHEGNPNADEGLVNFAGATSDASHVVIGSPVPLNATTAPDGGLYEWSMDKPANEKLSLVSVLPDGTAAGGVGTGRRADGLLGLSGDGSRIVFGVGGQRSDKIVYWSELYLRDVPSGETVPLGLNESGLPAGGIKLFQGASTDGSMTFFTDTEALTKDSGASGIESLAGGADLYLCKLASTGAGPLQCSLEDLTPIPAQGRPGSGEGARVVKVLGVSGDGSYVYFVAKGVQAAGATAGEENLYVAHEHEGVWTTSFIASSSLGFGSASAVSPDGRWLGFSAEAPLTGYDNRDAKTGLADGEVYLYDAATEKLICASCNPTGARPIGPSEVPPATRPKGFQYGTGATRSLFDSGRLFFDSGDALVSQDTNGNVDVYEFESPRSSAGVGDCSPQSSTFNVATEGCVGLISSGVAYGPSVFLEASGAGDDVFFTTAERLVPEDVDTAVDVYDAHECSASAPCPSPRLGKVEECGSATTCRGAPAAQPPIFGAPSSATFSGAGNAASEAHEKPNPKPTPEEVRKKDLAKALKACGKKRKRKQRLTCERKARARYAVKSSKSTSVRRSAATARRGRRG